MSIQMIETLISSQLPQSTSTTGSKGDVQSVESFSEQVKQAMGALEEESTLPVEENSLSESIQGEEVSDLETIPSQEEKPLLKEEEEETVVLPGWMASMIEEILPQDSTHLGDLSSSEVTEGEIQPVVWLDGAQPNPLSELTTIPIQELEKVTEEVFPEVLKMEEPVELMTDILELEGLSLPELEEGTSLQLEWEISSEESAPLTNEAGESFLSKGWSEQSLTNQAEELGVKAPEGGMNQRIQALLEQLTPTQSQPQVAMEMTQVMESQKPVVELQWNQREQLVTQIMNQTSVLKEGETAKLSLTLVPKHLGTMQLEFEMIQGQLRGKIITQSKEVSQWMERAIQSLSSDTLTLKTVQIEAQNETASYLFNHDQRQQQQESEQRPMLSSVNRMNAQSTEGENPTTPTEVDPQVRLIL